MDERTREFLLAEIDHLRTLVEIAGATYGAIPSVIDRISQVVREA